MGGCLCQCVADIEFTFEASSSAYIEQQQAGRVGESESFPNPKRGLMNLTKNRMVLRAFDRK